MVARARLPKPFNAFTDPEDGMMTLPFIVGRIRRMDLAERRSRHRGWSWSTGRRLTGRVDM